MDIGENVTAILCVIVGILIIGTALVPIVEHASSGTETTETITGSNEYYEGQYMVNITKGHTAVLENDLPATFDGMTFENNISILTNGIMGSLVCTIEPIMFVVADNDLQLGSGTVSLSPSQATITGTEYNNVGNSYSDTFALTDATISSSEESLMTSIAPPTEVYAFATSATIGDGQIIYLPYLESGDMKIATITTHTDELPTNDATMTKNDNGTITVNNDEGMMAPMEWTQTVTTSEGSSQYAALYGIIPIMCILGMGYVLIRRF